MAEGVETTAQLEELNSLGCSTAQGYLFSKPVPAGAAETLVEDEAFRRGLAQLTKGMQAGSPDDLGTLTSEASLEVCEK